MHNIKQLSSPVTEGQIKDIVRLLTELYGALKVEPTWAQINETALNNNVLAAFDGSTIVGMATLVARRQFGKIVAVAEDVVVMPEYRKRGIGTGLMRRLEWHARQAGADTVDLVTDDHRAPAKALYLSIGYKTRDKLNYRKSI